MNQYLKDTFGEKVYKISLDGGFTCPNRDGALGTGGCIFCSGMGSGDFVQGRGTSITEQIELGKEPLKNKCKSGKYIAYFQAFASTYAPVEQLRKLYTEAMEHPDIVALAIATRPDCLPKEVLELLFEMKQTKPVWVELGLQTIHEKTASYIRRGYELPVFEHAVNQLKKRNIPVVAHVILGLPGENKEDMKETVRYVGKCDVWGIKLQLLHVLKGTDLETEYRKGVFSTLEMEEYVKLVAECIALLPKSMVIHRLTGDGSKKDLVAPLWSADKKRVLNALNKAIARL